MSRSVESKPEDAPLPLGEAVSPAGPGRGPARRPLEGRTVLLRPLDPAADAEKLFACAHGDLGRERLWAYLPYGPFGSAAAMRPWLEDCAASEDPLFFTVLRKAGGRPVGPVGPVGMVSFLNIVPAMRSLELGHIWYGPAAQRTKVNTEAVYLMLRESFEALACRRVEWKCNALNARSRTAALRLGFTFEGVFRQHMIVKGRNRNSAWFSMLDHEWPAVKANMEAWLTGDGAPSLSALNAALRDAETG